MGEEEHSSTRERSKRLSGEEGRGRAPYMDNRNCAAGLEKRTWRRANPSEKKIWKQHHWREGGSRHRDVL
uniref:Uncharacterized protein n=1 Tax=Oryza glaberrima TaxID=4538 RepID=A0A679BCU8_ORYGL|nr:hypothetical protein [Oryza glaberrima]